MFESNTSLFCDIDKVNAQLKRFRVLKSAEVDVLEDGKLDYSKAMLKELDFTICSIHSSQHAGFLIAVPPWWSKLP